MVVRILLLLIALMLAGWLLRWVLHYLTEEVAMTLRRRGETARTITLKIRYENFETHTFSRTLPDAVD